MSEEPRLPADDMLSLARQWFYEPANHEDDGSPKPWLPDYNGENAVEYLAEFGMEVLRKFRATQGAEP